MRLGVDSHLLLPLLPPATSPLHYCFPGEGLSPCATSVHMEPFNSPYGIWIELLLYYTIIPRLRLDLNIFNQIDNGEATEDYDSALGKYFWCVKALMIIQNW